MADLARSGVKVALCDEQVPCGKVAAAVFAKAGVKVTPVSREANVKSTLAKVEINEVDAGIVYVTDVKAAGTKVTGVPIPAAQNASTDYPIAELTTARTPRWPRPSSTSWSAAGLAVLSAAGFTRP